MPKAPKRRPLTQGIFTVSRVLESAGAFDDLRFLRDASDPEHKRPGRFDLLLDIGELELEILAGRTATPELNRKVQALWQRGRGLQDLEIEAKVGRLAAAIRRQTGRRLMWATVQSIRSKGASRRDLWKLAIAFAATFLPFVPDHWFVLDPREVLSGLLSRKHTNPAKAG